MRTTSLIIAQVFLSLCCGAACGGSDSSGLFENGGGASSGGATSNGGAIGDGGDDTLATGGTVSSGGGASTGGSNTGGVQAGGTGGVGTGGGSGAECTPGTTETCACPAGLVGIQRCNSDGTTGECRCTSTSDGGTESQPDAEPPEPQPDANSSDEPPFGECRRGDDCPDGLVCFRSGGTEPSGRNPGYCTRQGCQGSPSFDCAQPWTGTAVAACSDYADYCTLDCADAECPDGMICQTVPPNIRRCNYPVNNND